MLRFIILAIFLAQTVLLLAAPVPPQGGRQLYFPTRVGTKWIYDTKGIDPYGEIVTESIEKNGRHLVSVKSTSIDFKDFPGTNISQYDVSNEGVRWLAYGLESPDAYHELKPPICLLKLPYTLGEKWGGDPKMDLPPRVTGKIEEVKVPAGTFNAIRVDRGKNSTDWFAPGFGIVKSQNGKVHLELKSFEIPNK